MHYEVDGWNNFCRVFQLPRQYPRGFCFGGGHPTTFIMVDWFNPVPYMGQPTVSKEVWREEVGEIETKEVDGDELAAKLTEFMLKKDYIEPGREYVVICDFGLSFTFKKEEDDE